MSIFNNFATVLTASLRAVESTIYAAPRFERTFSSTASVEKLKTHKGAAKRWKAISNGTFKRAQAGKGHLNSGMSASSLRGLSKTTYSSPTQTKILKRLLPGRALHTASRMSCEGSGSAVMRLSTRGLSSSTRSSSKHTSDFIWESKTHLRKPARIPNPLPAIYPQTVILSDGSSFTSYTTAPSPSFIRLTRDVTNHPVWNPSREGRKSSADAEEESGRLARFKRRGGGAGDFSWMDGETVVQEKVGAKQLGGPQKPAKGKKK